MENRIQICTFYKFKNLAPAEVENLKALIETEGQRLTLLGVFIIGPEGINSTFSGAPDSVETFKKLILNFLKSHETPEIFFKDSFCNRPPFHDLKIKVKNEIVTLARPGLTPDGPKKHLTPEEWEKSLQSADRPLVIDTRNDYEYSLGHFEGAINPNIEEFTEFPQYLEKSDIPKDKKIFIYCTGGIRCEKAILDMEEKGFKDVYQLEGGIINYLKHFPNSNFKGECFVFDYRVAVDQNLKPTETYRLCPHCGQPGKVQINCKQCATPEVVCELCLNKDPQYETCSKNCAHHFRMGHKTKRVHKDAFRKRGGREL